MRSFEDKVSEDIILHVLQKVTTAVQDGIEIIPDGHEPSLLISVTMQLLVGTVNALSEDPANPLFASLSYEQRVIVLSSLMARTLPGRPQGQGPFIQQLSDTAAAMAELKRHFHFKVVMET